jgi:hypothetical protein
MFGGNAPIPSNTGKSSDILTKSKQLIQDKVGSNLGLVVVVSVMCIIVIYIMVYIFRQYNSTSLKTITMLKKPIKVPQNTLYNISSQSDLAQLKNINGKEFSYSFWMYVDGDNLNATSSNKLVLGRMESENIMNSTPVFALDKSQNKLFVYVKKSQDSYISGINDINSNHRDVLTINYLPLQRWVNIVLVVDNNFVQLFMDGELREVKDLSNYSSGGTMETTVVMTPKGNMIVGANSANNNIMPAFNGYLSKVQVLNYAVTIDHAKVIYKAGPLHSSVLAAIGVPTEYGIQNPFYKINEQANIDKCTSPLIDDSNV